MSDKITFEELQELTGYENASDIAAALARENVEFFRGRRGVIYTFATLYYAAKGITPAPSSVQPENTPLRISHIS